MKFSELAASLDQMEATSSRNELVRILSEVYRACSPGELGPITYLIQGRLAPFFEPVEMGLGEKLLITAVALVGAVPGGITLPRGGGQWASLLYMALIAGAVALWAQTWAQSHLPATRAAIVMTMEPVFAAFFAVLFGGESLTARMLLGGGLVLTAMYVVEILGRRSPDATAEEDPPAELLHHEV